MPGYLLGRWYCAASIARIVPGGQSKVQSEALFGMENGDIKIDGEMLHQVGFKRGDPDYKNIVPQLEDNNRSTAKLIKSVN